MPTNEQQAIRKWLSKPTPYFGPCGCMGPRENEPECMCMMQMVEIVDGNYYKICEHRSPDGITHSAELIGKVK